jgi:hypothetical protein
MKTYKEYLNEEYFTGKMGKFWNVYFEIWKNPTKRELLKLGIKCRGLLYPKTGNIYFSDATKVLHSEMISNIPDNDSGVFKIISYFGNGGKFIIELTDINSIDKKYRNSNYQPKYDKINEDVKQKFSKNLKKISANWEIV